MLGFWPGHVNGFDKARKSVCRIDTSGAYW